MRKRRSETESKCRIYLKWEENTENVIIEIRECFLDNKTNLELICIEKEICKYLMTKKLQWNRNLRKCIESITQEWRIRQEKMQVTMHFRDQRFIYVIFEWNYYYNRTKSWFLSDAAFRLYARLVCLRFPSHLPIHVIYPSKVKWCKNNVLTAMLLLLSVTSTTFKCFLFCTKELQQNLTNLWLIRLIF